MIQSTSRSRNAELIWLELDLSSSCPTQLVYNYKSDSIISHKQRKGIDDVNIWPHGEQHNGIVKDTRGSSWRGNLDSAGVAPRLFRCLLTLDQRMKHNRGIFSLDKVEFLATGTLPWVLWKVGRGIRTDTGHEKVEKAGVLEA